MATMKALAGHLSMSTTVLADLIGRGIIDKKAQGKYDLDEARKQYILHSRAIASGRTKPADLDLQEERARLAKEQADAKEMENAVGRGELVYIEDVAKQFESQLVRIRTKVLAIPTKVSPEANAAVTVKEVQTLLEKALVEALNDLVGYDKEATG